MWWARLERNGLRIERQKRAKKCVWSVLLIKQSPPSRLAAVIQKSQTITTPTFYSSIAHLTYSTLNRTKQGWILTSRPWIVLPRMWTKNYCGPRNFHLSSIRKSIPPRSISRLSRSKSQTLILNALSVSADLADIKYWLLPSWAAGEVSRILSYEDDVVINLLFDLLEGSKNVRSPLSIHTDID
jgi:hypothetical protein